MVDLIKKFIQDRYVLMGYCENDSFILYTDGNFVSNFNPYITTFYDTIMLEKFADCYCEGGKFTLTMSNIPA